jgi:hypothetical protein
MRIGNTENYEDVEVENGDPLSAERMMPKAEFAGDGRVNPRGIPCLYLADTCSAVISEMRPWIGSYVTIAKFETVRDCLLVDCSLNTTQSWNRINLHTEPDIETKEQAVWGDIALVPSADTNS